MASVGLGPTGNLAVAVNPGGGESDDHHLLLQAFVDESRDGFVVRQPFEAPFGSPAITTVDSEDCARNALNQLPFNDVVCSGRRASASVSTRGGDDRVTIRDDPTLALSCVASLVDANNVPVPPPALRVTLDLGEGADTLRLERALICPPGSAAPGQSRWSVEGGGGGGDDDLDGGELNDTLGGGPGLDALNGGRGDDDLRGNADADTLEGAQDDDTLRGGGGNDTFRGGGGDDLMHGGLDGAGSDTFDGGPGVDTVNYAFAASGVSVTIETSNNSPDGQPEEGDAVFDNVENVTGSAHDDALVGDADANLLLGSPGNDTLTGAGGPDALFGEGGDDTLDARDGVRDGRINCGSGTDAVTADLADQPLFIRPFGPSGCESRLFFARDDGPPGRLTSGVLRIGPGGVAGVRLACPANARVACRGVLRLRTLTPRPRIRATARYAVARATTEAVEITVPASLRGRTLEAETVERGVSRKGPRSAVRSVRIR